eukprot:m.162954 g.162954  ORF g.162954 m.162954 type:complete len:470 (-) comp12250_c0_seq1:137-1546(-)
MKHRHDHHHSVNVGLMGHTIVFVTTLALVVTAVVTKANTTIAVPPRGWNGYDADLNHINETQLNATADALATQLLPHGYTHFVMDSGWFSGDIHDQYGRPRPNATLYPSTRVPTEPYTSLAPMVDAMRSRGLELGIWYIRGVYAPAAAAKLPIKGTPYTLDQIVNHDGDKGECLWDTIQIAANASHPGTAAYYDSLAELFVEEWGVSFVKFDCAYLPHGAESAMEELLLFSASMAKVKVRGTGRAPQLSVSPGGVRINPTRAQILVREMPNAMYRIQPDYHGGLPLGQMREAALLVEMGLYQANGTFPDWDMLPGVCATTMALWCVCGSPLMYGYSLPADPTSLSYLTNEDALTINAEATHVRPFLNPTANLSVANVSGWRSQTADGRVAVALVNIGDGVANTVTSFTEVGLDGGTMYDVLDVFAGTRRKGMQGSFPSTIPTYVKHNKDPSSGAILLLISPSSTRTTGR